MTAWTRSSAPACARLERVAYESDSGLHRRLAQAGFPQGPICLGETQAERLALVRDWREKFDYEGNQ
jgi:hypothetical protein